MLRELNNKDPNPSKGVMLQRKSGVIYDAMDTLMDNSKSVGELRARPVVVFYQHLTDSVS